MNARFFVGLATLVGAVAVACGSSSDGATIPDSTKPGEDARTVEPGADGSTPTDGATNPDAPSGPSVCISTKGVTGAEPCIGITRTLGDRPYCLNVPPSAMGKPAPVVVLLHGYGASGQAQSSYFDFDAAATKHGFILAKPDGKTNGLGSKYWNATAACCSIPSDPTDDVAYITSIVDDLKASQRVDAKRVYAVGHSNGGFMAHRLGCDRSNVFAAIVSLAGMVDPAKCAPTDKISVLQVHGDADAVIKYEGGNTTGNPNPYPSVDTTLATWAQKNGCSGQRAAKGTLDLNCNAGSVPLPGEETKRESFDGCPAGIDVSLLRINGGGHIPDFLVPAWGDAVVAFLMAHPKP